MFTFAANPTCSRKSISSLLVISSLHANTSSSCSRSSSSSLSSFSDSFPPIQFLFSWFSSIFYYYFYLLQFGSSGLRNQRYFDQAQDRTVVECEGCVCHVYSISLSPFLLSGFIEPARRSYVCVSFLCQRFLFWSLSSVLVSFSFYFRLLCFIQKPC